MQMAKAPVVEEAQIRHALKVAAITGQAKLRDVALLWVLYGTGMMPIELAKLTVGDYLAADGSVREESEIRAGIAFNDKSRPLYWSNKSVVTAVAEEAAASSLVAARVTVAPLVRVGASLTAVTVSDAEAVWLE